MMRATKICATAIALTIATSLAACGSGSEKTDASTEIKMDDVDALDGTISDAIPNPDLLTNPDNIPESQAATADSTNETKPADGDAKPQPPTNSAPAASAQPDSADD